MKRSLERGLSLSAVRTTLRAHRDLTILPPNGAPAWRVTGGRPLLEASSTPAPGWYVITTDLVTGDDADGSPVAIRFLPDRGMVPLARRPIPVVGGKRARVVHVPEGATRMLVEVSPWLDLVAAADLRFRALPNAAAAALMSADVAASSALGSTDRTALIADLRSANEAGGPRASLQQIAVAYEQLQHRRSGDSVDYSSWRIRNAVLFDDDVARLRRRLDALPDRGPSISVIMPVHDPDERWLRAAIESVRCQVYENWQLIVVDDASTDPRVRSILREYASLDDRIRARFRSENGHISAATNDGLADATGEFVAFMDHDDELAPFALAVVVLAAAAGNADVLYTDEDKIDTSGRHSAPHCKPRWNPELLLGQNYISHLTVIRRSIVESVGRLRPSFDGSQDHDLLLRVTAEVSADRIVHVPFVAYHWRSVPGSTARSAAEKSYTEDASIAALSDHLRDGWTVQRAAAPTTYRCTPPMLDYPLVSILIPTRDRLDLLRQCVDSLARTTYPAFEIVVIDNDSAEPQTLSWLEAFDNGHDHRVLQHRGVFNYSAVNNAAARSARGDVFCLLNNDTEVIEPGWLDEMVRWIQQPDVGVVGAKLLYGNGTIQHAGVVLGLGGLAGHGHHLVEGDAFGYFNRLTIAHEVGAVTGACLLTWRATWDQLGGLDEELAVAFNDIDYCLRVRNHAEQRIIWTPHARLYHHESLSRGAEDDPVKVARFNDEVDRVMKRWAERLHDDPAYSPNLSLDADAFSLARAPRVAAPWHDDSP